MIEFILGIIVGLIAMGIFIGGKNEWRNRENWKSS